MGKEFITAWIYLPMESKPLKIFLTGSIFFNLFSSMVNSLRVDGRSTDLRVKLTTNKKALLRETARGGPPTM